MTQRELTKEEMQEMVRSLGPEGRMIDDFVKRDSDKFNQMLIDTCQLLNIAQIAEYLNKFEVEVITTLIEAKTHIMVTLGENETATRKKMCNNLISGIAIYRDNNRKGK